VITLGLLGGFGFVVGEQLTSLARRLPGYQQNIETKLTRLLPPSGQSTGDRLSRMVKELSSKFSSSPPSKTDEAAEVQKVEIVAQPSLPAWLRLSGGPYLEFLGAGSFVLVLVLFMLMSREDLSDRIVGLFGHHHVSLTTRTMEEIGRRISKYLATFALVNSCFGLIIGLGLELIGVPYAVLWGCLAAMLRFIPYVGSAVAFALPLLFSFAHFPGWRQLLEVVALFGLVEIALNSFLEPVIYGKTTGVTALGLLVAAMFWTWLWGSLGLLLSTPLTVCLAVLGKYVPSLHFFAILLGEDAELKPDVRLYQRLVALDKEGALEIIDSALEGRSRMELFDQLLVPTLSRAARDASRYELDEAEQAFVWQVIGEVLDRLESTPDIDLAAAAVSENVAPLPDDGASAAFNGSLVGLAANDNSDTLVLRMLRQVLAVSGLDLEVLTNTGLLLESAQQIADLNPALVVVSHVPSEGRTSAHYLARRLRAHFAELPLVLGLWGESGTAATASEKMVGNGTYRLVFTLGEARDRILNNVSPGENPKGLVPVLSA
jgi:predicted PurR-regulated permease PerM